MNTQMKLQNIHQVSTLASARSELINSIAQISNDKALGVTINGRYQDDAMLDAVRPAVLANLQQRVKSIDSELSALGVEVGGE